MAKFESSVVANRGIENLFAHVVDLANERLEVANFGNPPVMRALA